MDNHKICFIMCSNNEFLAKECLLYIDQLEIPKGYDVETKVVYGSKSMTSGYNKAMQESDAKYKVYLHQDVLLIEKKFIQKIVSLFTSHPEIGMLGVVGNKSLAEDGCPWSDGMGRRIGELYSDLIYKNVHCVFSKIQEEYEKAIVLDGLLMVTQYDLPWREDLFQGWDFYDCSQSLEFWKAGYQVVVPHMESPWCLHDNDILKLENYEQWRIIFEREYKSYYKDLRIWKEEKMSKRSLRKVIYQLFHKNETVMPFPYPPIYKEKEVDYICFTDDTSVKSKYWNMCYVENIDTMDLEMYLKDYDEKFELMQNQIQICDVFSECKNWDGVIIVPLFEELPNLTFDCNKIIPTADEQGNYNYRKNPEYTNGKYNGHPMMLTIGVPVSNQIDTIEKCLNGIKPLLDHLDAELIVIDTGSTDGTVDICKSYGARIIKKPWCDNMSAVRNEGIYHARGEWYLSIDDDEWFEDVDEILKFFQSGLYQKCNSASYIQRNYLLRSEEIYTDSYVLRMARITPELHFEGRIHDALILPSYDKNCQLLSYAHHYGFLSDNKERAKEKYIRNAEILLYDMYEYPKNLRYNFQFANELKCERYYEDAIAYFFRGISIEKEVTNAFFGKLHIVNLISCLYEARDKRIFYYADYFKVKFKMTYAEKAFIYFCLEDMALRYQKPADEILNYYHKYHSYKRKYEKDPYDSNQNSFVGISFVTNEPYIMDSYVIAFCAYVDKKDNVNACKELQKIKIDKILDQIHAFFEHLVIAEDEVYQSALKQFSKQEFEQYKEEIMDAFLVSICRDEIYKQQFERFSVLLENFSIQELKNYMTSFYGQFVPKMQERIYAYAMECNLKDCSIQMLYVYGFVLQSEYIKVGKQERNMDLFIQYVCVMGKFISRYYHPMLLENYECNAISSDNRAIYHIYMVLQDGNMNSKNVGRLKQAIEIFPGFKSEIQWILDQFMVSEQKKASPEEEMKVLTETLKNQARTLLSDGKAEEAASILRELTEYVPDDNEVRSLLLQANQDKFMRI